MNSKRQKAEELIYKIYDTVDPTHTNSDYYRKIFADMSDSEFEKFCSGRLPFRFHEEVFKIEPKMYQIFDAFKILDKPLLEKVKLPYIYTNKDGVPVESKEALVIYIHLKRMKQMLTKKNNTAIDIDKRDMKTGLLIGEDKGGKETDREFESLATMGLEYTMDEFARPKADAMAAMSQMSNTILAKGYVSDKDIDVTKDDSIGKNLLNTYLIGSHIHSNLVDINYMTPLTARNKQTRIERR
jgi:hypothetical protein